MCGVSKSVVKRLRNQFPKGQRVKLEQMDDPQAPPKGTEGTVAHVDDVGTIHVKWDNGCGLGVAYGDDKCVRI